MRRLHERPITQADLDLIDTELAALYREDEERMECGLAGWAIAIGAGVALWVVLIIAILQWGGY